jgi:hypothetical protein
MLPIATMPSDAEVGEICRLRAQQELIRRFTVPERLKPARPPELTKPSPIITYRRYTNWRLKLAGIKP